MAPEEPNGKRDHVMAGIARAGGSLLKIGSLALLVYVVAMSIFAISKYTTTKSTLLSYGISDATGSLIAWAVMLIAIGIPGLAIVRLFFFRGRPYNYVAAMILPLISWGMAQIPANFDQTGAALKFCSNRPDGTLFCLDHPGIDPLTQTKLVPMNPSLADLEFRKKRGLVPKRIALPLAELVFFDPLTGQPKVWVSKSDQGCFDMFDNRGVNPQTGEELQPVTIAIVRSINACLHKARTDSLSPDTKTAQGRENQDPQGVPRANTSQGPSTPSLSAIMDQYWKFPSRDEPRTLWPTWDIPPRGNVIIQRQSGLGIWVEAVNGTQHDYLAYNHYDSGENCLFGDQCAGNARSVLVENKSGRVLTIRWATFK